MNYEEITYEGYGPVGVAVIVDVLTDNKNRAVSEVRHAFSKNGGNLGESNSVSLDVYEEGRHCGCEGCGLGGQADGDRAGVGCGGSQRRRRELGDSVRSEGLRERGGGVEGGEDYAGTR